MIAVDIARILFKLKVNDAELLETEYQRIEERRADLVARMYVEEGGYILHIEIQNQNDPGMPLRMLRYGTDILSHYPDEELRQYLLYIGKAPLNMADGIEQPGHSYHYPIIDMHNIDCQQMIELDTPDALVLAILCDFGDKPKEEVLHYLVTRLDQLTGENEAEFRNYFSMMEILSTNRDLEKLLKEEEKMLSQVKLSELPSYEIGMEAGMQQGMQQGEVTLLVRLIEKKFGPLEPQTTQKLEKATTEQLEQWASNILEANTLEELFARH